MSVALVIQHTKCMRLIMFSSVDCLALDIFPHCLVNGTIFGKKFLNIKCLDLLDNFHLKHFLILSITEQNIFINICRSECEVPFILVRF